MQCFLRYDFGVVLLWPMCFGFGFGFVFLTRCLGQLTRPSTNLVTNPTAPLVAPN